MKLIESLREKARREVERYEYDLDQVRIGRMNTCREREKVAIDAKVLDALCDAAEALEKAADTFGDLKRFLKLIGKGPSVEACGIAEDASRTAFAKLAALEQK